MLLCKSRWCCRHKQRASLLIELTSLETLSIVCVRNVTVTSSVAHFQLRPVFISYWLSHNLTKEEFEFQMKMDARECITMWLPPTFLLPSVPHAPPPGSFCPCFSTSVLLFPPCSLSPPLRFQCCHVLSSLHHHSSRSARESPPWSNSSWNVFL